MDIKKDFRTLSFISSKILYSNFIGQEVPPGIKAILGAQAMASD
jgi:hypothetical protein